MPLFLGFFDVFLHNYLSLGDPLDPATMPHPANLAVLSALALNAAGAALVWIGDPGMLALCASLLFPTRQGTQRKTDI